MIESSAELVCFAMARALACEAWDPDIRWGHLMHAPDHFDSLDSSKPSETASHLELALSSVHNTVEASTSQDNRDPPQHLPHLISWLLGCNCVKLLCQGIFLQQGLIKEESITPSRAMRISQHIPVGARKYSQIGF